MLFSRTTATIAATALAVTLAARPGLAAEKKRSAPVRASSAFRSRVLSLDVRPASVLLDGEGQQQALLVTGNLADGSWVDLTFSSQVRVVRPNLARWTAQRVIEGIADGATAVEVTAAGKVVRVPVVVRHAARARAVSFRNDVLPVLARSGCYQGACHAKQGGKNGFQLSVLAFDPEADYQAICRQGHGRRVSRTEPARSLFLTKPTLGVPHGGGRRFAVGSAEYRLLARWIAEGASYGDADPTLTRVEVEPKERVLLGKASQPLLVTAYYSDGSRRDVSRLAQFRSNEAGIADVTPEGVIQAAGFGGEAAIMARFMGQVAVARVTVPLNAPVAAREYASLLRRNFIDEPVYRKLAQLNLLPSEPCDDATFLRRVSLDLIGTLPTAAETQAFLEECGSGKGSARQPEPRTLNPEPSQRARERLVDRLLARTEYADYWAMRWSGLLLVNPDLLSPRGAYAFDHWLRQAFRENMPFDRFAHEIVTASGDSYREGPPNFFRALPIPGDAARAVSQLFLGVRLDCAQCHHHPFERWGQDDFYGLAAYFARVKDKGSYPEGYLSIIYDAPEGEVKYPKSGQVMAARPLGGEPDGHAKDDEDRREALARWMTAPDNPFFARTIVNRMWALMMGRGLVEPVDDFRVTNPATNEPLLDALAKEFVEHGYDLKHLLRTIVLSAAYQRSATASVNNRRDVRNYSHALARRLPAEVLLDALGQVTGVRESFRGHPEGTLAIQMWDARLGVEFLDLFGRPGRQSVCECERTNDGSVGQMLHMMNSEEMQRRLAVESGTAAALDRSGKPPATIVEELYLTALCRAPTTQERDALVAAFDRKGVSRKAAIEDILWALLNSPEFLLNH